MYKCITKKNSVKKMKLKNFFQTMPLSIHMKNISFCLFSDDIMKYSSFIIITRIRCAQKFCEKKMSDKNLFSLHLCINNLIEFCIKTICVMIFITRLISGRTSKMVNDQCEMVFNLCCEFFF